MDTLKVKDSDGNDKYLLVGRVNISGATPGSSSNPFVTISQDYIRALTVEGNLFDVSAYASVNDNSDINVLCVTPAAPVTITSLQLTVTGDSSPLVLNLYEGTVVSNNGTTLAARNHNRQSAATMSAALYASPTITSNGTKLETRYYGAGTGFSSAQLETDLSNRWVLKQNTNYLVKITNNSGNNNVNIGLVWTLQDGI
jgi:hypothetical protein